jgi:hypothetical protein
MAPTAEAKVAAEKLKTEVDALYTKCKDKVANTKYTEAIKHDGTNVALYANRSACSLEMK